MWDAAAASEDDLGEETCMRQRIPSDTLVTHDDLPQ
jgi:hypothetical protein